MLFWIFMLIMDLMLPLTMIIFGRRFIKNAPREINEVFGYRTTMSMKSKDTWEYAHNYCGKVWYISGLIMIPITAIIMLFAFGKSTAYIGVTGGIVCAIQLIPAIVSLFLTENALKKAFDKNGCRR